MKRIDNIIFLILIFCCSMCGFWLYQLSKYKLPQIALENKMLQGKILTPPKTPTPQPLVELPSDRNIFKLPWREEDIDVGFVEDTTTFQKPHLSTICWIDELPLAIINDEILTKGDKDTRSQFQVETITRDRVGIRFISNGEYVWLTLGDEGKDLSSFVHLPEKNTLEE